MSSSFSTPKIYPLAWLVIAMMLMWALDRWLPLMTIAPAPVHWLGMLLLIPGAALVLYCGIGFIKVKTGLLPFTAATQLVTGGFYRITRNPMYLGMVVFLTGVAILLGSLSPLAGTIGFAWVIDRQFIRNEEVFLTHAFGDEYVDYMTRVRRWI